MITTIWISGFIAISPLHELELNCLPEKTMDNIEESFAFKLLMFILPSVIIKFIDIVCLVTAVLLLF